MKIAVVEFGNIRDEKELSRLLLGFVGEGKGGDGGEKWEGDSKGRFGGEDFEVGGEESEKCSEVKHLIIE